MRCPRCRSKRIREDGRVIGEYRRWMARYLTCRECKLEFERERRRAA